MPISMVVVGKNQVRFLPAQICGLLHYSVTAQAVVVCENSVLPAKNAHLLLLS